jgi:hypothetical protein
MKKYLALFTIIIIVALNACKKKEKAPVTVPVQFPTTTYESLGTYDSEGKPSYLVSPDNISTNMKSFINGILIEKSDLRPRHPELLSTTAIADVAITQPSDVFVTFVAQTTNSPNAIAFYTYSTKTPPVSPKDIKTITYFFPSAGLGTALKAGDKVKIGRFEAGTSIGFVLLKSAWDSTTHTLDNKVVHFCSNDVLNPEVDPALKKHAVLINYVAENKVLIGFENTDRTNSKCDHDFNDIVIYTTVTP